MQKSQDSYRRSLFLPCNFLWIIPVLFVSGVISRWIITIKLDEFMSKERKRPKKIIIIIIMIVVIKDKRVRE